MLRLQLSHVHHLTWQFIATVTTLIGKHATCVCSWSKFIKKISKPKVGKPLQSVFILTRLKYCSGTRAYFQHSYGFILRFYSCILRLLRTPIASFRMKKFHGNAWIWLFVVIVLFIRKIWIFHLRWISRNQPHFWHMILKRKVITVLLSWQQILLIQVFQKNYGDRRSFENLFSCDVLASFKTCICHDANFF